ncbi:MAG: RNA polymerase sigma factor [Patescibacteria group bacterium]
MSNRFNERILLYRVRRGDAEAFSPLYDQYIDKIYRFVYLKVATPQDAEDITAETFLKVWHYIRDGKKVQYFQALLYRTARNLVVDFYRRKGVAPVSIEETEIVVADRSDLTLEEKMDLKLDLNKIEESLRQLKDAYREVIVLHFLNELSIKEIAAILESSPGAVRVLLHRGVKALRKMIDA